MENHFLFLLYNNKKVKCGKCLTSLLKKLINLQILIKYANKYVGQRVGMRIGSYWLKWETGNQKPNPKPESKPESKPKPEPKPEAESDIAPYLIVRNTLLNHVPSNGVATGKEMFEPAFTRVFANVNLTRYAYFSSSSKCKYFFSFNWSKFHYFYGNFKQARASNYWFQKECLRNIFSSDQIDPGFFIKFFQKTWWKNWSICKFSWNMLTNTLGTRVGMRIRSY